MNTTGTNQVIVGYGNATGYESFTLYLTNSYLVSIGNWTSGATANGNTTLSGNNWYNILITFSGGVVKYYLNGVYDGTGTISNTNTTLGSLSIGAQINSSQFLSGLISNVSIWNRILDESQIKLVYNSNF